MHDRWRERTRRADFRAGRIAAVIANLFASPGGSLATAADFVPGEKVAPSQDPDGEAEEETSPEGLAIILKNWTRQMGGKVCGE